MMIKSKRYSRKKIYKGYCFDVVSDDVLWPNGRRLKRDLIVHGGISVIVPELDRKHLILVRQYRYGPGKELWEVPAGTVDRGETALACAKREIVEEIGYEARHWRKLASCYVSPGFNTEVIHCFRASELSKAASALEDDEILKPRVFSHNRVKSMMSKRQIVDAKSLIALFYFFLKRA